MNALKSNNYLPSQPQSVLLGNVQYIFGRSDKSLSRQDATKNKVIRIYMTYETFCTLNKNAFKKAPLLLPAPNIVGLLPAPPPSRIGQVIAIAGLSQTCTIERVFDKWDETWVQVRHPYGIATRKLSEIGD